MRGMLLVIFLTCIAVVLFQNYLARREFGNGKDETANRLLALDMSAAQNRAIRKTLDLITYENRLDPRIAFASIEKSLIASKLESAGMGPHQLSVGWFDLNRSVDTIRLGLKNGGHVDYQLQEEYEYDSFYYQATLFLGEYGIGNGREIESVSLISNGKSFSKPVSPVLILPPANEE